MKRLTVLTLAALLMLCSCAVQPEPAATTPPPTETIPVREPLGIYDAASKLEKETDGAIKAYPLNKPDAAGFAPMGSDLLVFAGEEITTLTRFSGEMLRAVATTTLDHGISPLDAAVRVSEQGITYYDHPKNQLVFLDADLQEIKRQTMPAALCGTPALSTDCSEFYYCTSGALRCMDLETGLDRLIMQLQFSYQTLTALHCNDIIVVCDVRDERGHSRQLYVSTDTGEILHEAEDDLVLHTDGASYFAQHKDGGYTEFLSGDSEQGPTLLTPHTYGSVAFPLFELGSVVMVTADASTNTTTLDCYNLLSGKRISSIILKELNSIRSIQADQEAQKIWFLRYDPQYRSDVLYCWDWSKSAVSDNRSCLSRRYTSDNPDWDGLFSCREIADRLSQTYGVQVLLWDDATSYQPWDYTLVPEYQVPLIREKLKELELFLSMYPEGFLPLCAEKTTSGRIQICLVRSILGNEAVDGSLSEAVGLQYWDSNRNTYLCLSLQYDGLFRNACHEMSHIIDSRVLTFCRAYDDWNKLNPEGFQYNNNYISNLSRDDRQWTEGAERAFIDTYSMSYPKEDRARIMEYAMMDGNETCFESETMQKKLRQLCIGIREAFGLKKSPEVFRWEQYLKEPLNRK
ncbi:MAG: hypothetical protein IKT52_11340 [Oscillospiraceae bacterium]|nr:hypothetical protein [Oscillospiraceae bacterium]